MVTFFLCKVSRSSTKAQRKGTKYSFKMKCLRCKTYSQQLCKYVFCTSLIQLMIYVKNGKHYPVSYEKKQKHFETEKNTSNATLK